MKRLNSQRENGGTVASKGDRKSLISTSILDKSNQSMSKEHDTSRQIGLEEESFNL
jgi:hypothetical protein